MRVAIACDHGGYSLKNMVVETVRKGGHIPLDFGSHNLDSVDYPDYAEKVGRAIQSGDAERGIVICGSGVGACIAANKMKGILAGVCHDVYSAHQAVEHDNMNVLCLGARVIGPELAREIVEAYLPAKFSNKERHIRRVGKIIALENKLAKS